MLKLNFFFVKVTLFGLDGKDTLPLLQTGAMWKPKDQDFREEAKHEYVCAISECPQKYFVTPQELCQLRGC